MLRDLDVLLVDLDPQGNATMGAGVDKRALTYTVYQVLLGERKIADVRMASPSGGFDLVPSNRELAGAEVARLAENADFRARKAEHARAEVAGDTFATVAGELDELYGSLAHRRHAPHPEADPLADRPWILCDLHMHTSWSHDCAVDPADLIIYAEGSGLGGIAANRHEVGGLDLGPLHVSSTSIWIPIVIIAVVYGFWLNRRDPALGGGTRDLRGAAREVR